ncbi:type II 3-dehydroquinate dehydratase [Pelagibacterales bacterium SAG-MED15]|nr:type II 3-dehydroquinate dehydratase [Pelagibacterales bacterium SAG-MED15]
MTKRILIINGPNLNLLGEREQSHYGAASFEDLKNECLKKSKELKIELNILQSNIEGEIVSHIQDARKKYDGLIINAAGFTHTSVAIRDALDIFKKPSIELHISNIYKREEFRHKSLISGVVSGGIFGLGTEGYILAIIAIDKILKNEN